MMDKMPCDCIEKYKGAWIMDCTCGNSGDFSDAAQWIERQRRVDQLATNNATGGNMTKQESEAWFEIKAQVSPTVTTDREERRYQAFKARLLDELHAETEHGDKVIINTYAEDS